MAGDADELLGGRPGTVARYFLSSYVGLSVIFFPHSRLIVVSRNGVESSGMTACPSKWQYRSFEI